MTDLDFQEQLLSDAAFIKWRNEVDLPRVRTRIQEHKNEMGCKGQYMKLLTRYDELIETEEELFWRCKRYETSKAKKQPYSELAMIAYFIPENAERSRKIRREIEFLKAALFRPETAKQDTITQDMIERAKEYPIENLIEARRGFALCLWHDDSTPSLYTKNNFAHCFSCGKTGDTIAVYQKLNGATFPEAVKALQ